MSHQACAGSVKIVTFGDSTTAPRPNVEIYTDQLRARFPDVQFVNRGVGGNDTGMASLRFEKDVLAERPQLVIVQFGINDSTVDVWKVPPRSEPRVSLTIFEHNMRRFILDIRKAGGFPVLMTPNQIRWTDELRRLYGKPPYDPASETGFSGILAKYAAITRKLAFEYQVPLVDVFALYDKWEKDHQLSGSKLLTDGMHPNSDGQRLVADALEPIVKQFLANPPPSVKSPPDVP